MQAVLKRVRARFEAERHAGDESLSEAVTQFV